MRFEVISNLRARSSARGLWILGLLLLCSCGNSHPGLTWPVYIASTTNFSDKDKDRAFEAINELNAKLSKEAIYFEQSEKTHSYIDLEIVDVIPQDVNVSSFRLGMPLQLDTQTRPATTSRIAGRATLEDGKCKITLARFVLDSVSDLLHPVLWHEIGHAGGLGHLTEAGFIMSPSTLPLDRYTEDKVESFADSWAGAIGITRPTKPTTAFH